MKKKTSTLLLALALVISVTACDGAGSNTEDSTDNKETEETFQEEQSDETDKNDLPEQNNSAGVESEEIISIAPEYEDGSVEKDIQNYAAKIIKEDYTDTDIQELAINENLGTEESGDYIILARLTWNVKNSGSTSKEMLEMYSDDFAARIGKDQLAVNEIAVFWTVPYLDDANAKWAYERSGEGMYLSDNMADTIFSDDSLFR